VKTFALILAWAAWLLAEWLVERWGQRLDRSEDLPPR